MYKPTMWLHSSDTKSDFVGLFNRGNFPRVQNLHESLFDATLNSLSNERLNGLIFELFLIFDFRKVTNQTRIIKLRENLNSALLAV